MFAPKDVVYVSGDGCVQTGGSGPTWKRYVNPSGADSDHRYHGLIRIPSAKLAGTDVGSSLTRIKDVVGRPLLVTGQDVPLSQLVLHLGYEDDNYGDNGYDRHDDGTEDQCKQDINPVYGGPALITIRICRGTGCAPPPSRYPFDVVSNKLDPNGFLYNPHWSGQDRPGNLGSMPPTSVCHEFSKRDFGRPVPKPNFPDCTDQSGLENVDDGGLTGNALLCWAAKVPQGATAPALPQSFPGHVNWFPVTIEGHAGPVTHEWKDDDYDFSLRSCDSQVAGSCDRTLYTNGRDFLHVEFDSDETIDYFRSPEWAALKANVDNGSSVAAQLFSGHTIMTGLFGLDGEHELKSELHPLYAMATERDVESDARDDAWLIFVRNLGDEGFCSSQIWSGGFEDYTFRLPWRPGMTSVDVDWDRTDFELTPGASGPVVSAVRPFAKPSRTGPGAGNGVLALPAGFAAEGAGVFVTFHLGHATTLPAGSGTFPFVDGVLYLKWSGPETNAGPSTAERQPGRNRVTGPTVAMERAAGKADEDGLDAAVNALSPQQRALVQRSRATGAPARQPTTQRAQGGGQLQVLDAPPLTGVWAGSTRPHEPVAGAVGPATRKLARDEALIHALCAAGNNAPQGVPAEVCNPDVRDHRTPSPPPRDHRTPSPPPRDHRTTPPPG